MDVKLSPGPFLHQLKVLNLSNRGSRIGFEPFNLNIFTMKNHFEP